MLRITLLTLTVICILPYSLIACTGGSNSGSLAPTVAYQTQAISNGQYYTVNVSCGNTYNFTFCGNGGSAAWDTQLTILNASGTVEIIDNDDFCGLQSDLTWTADFTGTIQILVSRYFCNNDGTSNGTLAYNMTPGTLNPAFTLSGECGGLNAVITGDAGGTFSWNPSDPGDGAVLNASTGQVTSGVNGTTYTIDYTICSTTSTQSATVPTGDCWTLNGDASYVMIGGEQCLELTSATNGQTGCAWNGAQIDFASPFTLTLDYYFGNNINGADGSTFSFQPSSSSACGTAGGQLGAGALNNALTIEFDTYDNDNPAHIYDMSCDHIAVEIDGNLQGPGAPLCGPVCAKAGGGNIDDGGTYSVDIAWDPVTQQLDIYFNSVLRLSCTHDFITNVFGTNIVYWGVTSATGGLNNQQYFCPSTVVLPVELSSFTNHCTGNSERIQWETISENKVSHFVVESTRDGILFQPVETVDAVGNSQSTNTYFVDVDTESIGQKLYRLKIIDDDGSFEYSSLIASKNCHDDTAIISKVSTDANGVTIEINEPVSFTIYNQLGQTISSRPTAAHEINLSSKDLAGGVYLVHLINAQGVMEIQRVFIR